MRRYEQVPEALALDTRLSLGARAAYPILRHLAWRAGRRTEGDAVEMPPVSEIARVLGAAASTTKGYLAELRGSGWIEVTRAARNRPSLYVIHDDPSVLRNPAHGSSGIRPTGEGSSTYRGTDIDRRTANAVVPEDESQPPKAVKVDGQDLPFNALVTACGIAPSSPRLGIVGVALNGPRGVSEQGIRTQYARETHARGLHWTTAEAFERALAAEIPRRAALYRRKMSGATLTPTALAKWWTDLPGLPEPGRGDGRLSAGDVLAQAQREADGR